VAKSLTCRVCWLQLEIAQNCTTGRFVLPATLLGWHKLPNSPNRAHAPLQSPVAQLRKIETIAAMRIKPFGLLCMRNPTRKLCFEPTASRPAYFFTHGIDVMGQIRLFGKLKLRSCARAGNRAGLFRF
jgi:hypothetical protein